MLEQFSRNNLPGRARAALVAKARRSIFGATWRNIKNYCACRKGFSKASPVLPVTLL